MKMGVVFFVFALGDVCPQTTPKKEFEEKRFNEKTCVIANTVL